MKKHNLRQIKNIKHPSYTIALLQQHLKTCCLILISCSISNVHAQPSDNKKTNIQILDTKKADAEVKRFTQLDHSKAKFSLDFVGVFENGEEGYQNYLKRGYPKISRKVFDENAPGGMSVYNNSKKLRIFYTTQHTVYKAHCITAPTANNEGEVQMTLREFAWVLNKKNVRVKEATNFQSKFKSCFSQDSNLVYLTYKGNKIESIGFHWIP